MALASAAAALLLGAALVVLIIAVVGQRDAARTAFRSQQALIAGSRLEASLITVENGLRGFVASGRARYLAPGERALGAYPRQLEGLSALISDDAAQQERLRRLSGAVDDYVALWVRPLIAVARDRPASARSVVATNGGRQRLDAIRRDFARLATRERIVAEARERSAERRSSMAIAVGGGALGLVIAVATGLGLYLRRTVVRPVVAVARATTRVAEGELAVRVPADRADEVGDLARNFNAMAGSLQRSQAELADRNRELELFASATSHDLQAPLVTISMYAELLRRRHGAQLDGGVELLDAISGATGQARGLIRDLLEFSRAGRGSLELEEVDVREVVQLALGALAGAIEEAGARVDVGPMPVLPADRAGLCRVFQNLLGNAIKFSDGGAPEVRVEAVREEAGWRLTVRDKGIGMDPRHAERVFEPFQRLNGEDDYPGTGIGLAVCERIVAQHGGRIWVDSAPGEGSAFSFTLPAERAA